MKYLVQTLNEPTPISEIFCRYVTRTVWGSLKKAHSIGLTWTAFVSEAQPGMAAFFLR